jgi:hypothetical protein
LTIEDLARVSDTPSQEEIEEEEQKRAFDEAWAEATGPATPKEIATARRVLGNIIEGEQTIEPTKKKRAPSNISPLLTC